MSRSLSMALNCQWQAEECSSKVQQPLRMAPTSYDRHSPVTCVKDLYRPSCT